MSCMFPTLNYESVEHYQGEGIEAECADPRIVGLPAFSSEKGVLIEALKAFKCFPTSKEMKEKFVKNLLPEDFINFEDNKGFKNQRLALINPETEFFIVNFEYSHKGKTTFNLIT